MKFRFPGKMSVEELEERLAKAIEELKRYEVEAISGINLYVNLWLDGNEVELSKKDGTIIESIQIGTAKKKKIQKKSTSNGNVIGFPQQENVKEVLKH